MKVEKFFNLLSGSYRIQKTSDIIQAESKGLRIGSSVHFSCSVVSDSLWPHGLQHARPPNPSPTPGVYPNSCPLSWWCHPTIFLLSHSPSAFNLSQQQGFSNVSALRIRWPKYCSFSFISPSNEHPGLIFFRMTGWISLQSKGLSRVFSNTTVQKHQFFGAQLYL